MTITDSQRTHATKRVWIIAEQKITDATNGEHVSSIEQGNIIGSINTAAMDLVEHITWSDDPQSIQDEIAAFDKRKFTAGE